MWKVALEREFLKLEFIFSDIQDAYCFIDTALRANRTIKAIVTLEDENKAVEEGEE